MTNKQEQMQEMLQRLLKSVSYDDNYEISKTIDLVQSTRNIILYNDEASAVYKIYSKLYCAGWLSWKDGSDEMILDSLDEYLNSISNHEKVSILLRK